MPQLVLYDLIGVKELLKNKDPEGIQLMLKLHQYGYNLSLNPVPFSRKSERNMQIYLHPIVYCFSDSILLAFEEDVEDEEFICYAEKLHKKLPQSILKYSCIISISDDTEEKILKFAGNIMSTEGYNFNFIPGSRTEAFRNIFFVENLIKDNNWQSYYCFVCSPKGITTIGNILKNIDDVYEIRNL